MPATSAGMTGINERVVEFAFHRSRSGLDQPYFPCSRPMLHCFLTLDCQSNVVIALAVNEHLFRPRIALSIRPPSRRDAQTRGVANCW